MPDVLKQMRNDAVEIFRHAVAAVNPDTALRNFVVREGEALRIGPEHGDPLRLDLNAFQRILVVGAGKATAPMAQALEDILGERLTEGLINVKYGFTAPLRKVAIIEAGHPVPDANGLEGTRRMRALLESARAADLVFSLISGGGSALLPQPAGRVTLAQKQALTRDLLASGATIEEINTVRKHLSLVKGGQMARAAAPATVINLMLSDVVGDPMDVIASGPFVPDPSTFGEALWILDRYGLGAMPAAIREHLEAGAAGQIPETPKAGDPAFARVSNHIIGNNLKALRAAASRAGQLGYRTLILSSMVEGETREVARVHTAIAREILGSGHPIPVPACVISGGETTVTIRGQGRGGRNQEFGLAAAIALESLPPRVVILSGGTDGNDGPTDAAGATVDPTSVQRGRQGGRDAPAALADNDAYPYLAATGDLLVTGPTNTNVMDVRLILVR